MKGENIPEPGIPESFKVLVKEMQSLCLDVEVISETGEEIELKEEDDDILKAAEAMGLDLAGLGAPRPAAEETEGMLSLEDLDAGDLDLDFDLDDDSVDSGDKAEE